LPGAVVGVVPPGLGDVPPGDVPGGFVAPGLDDPGFDELLDVPRSVVDDFAPVAPLATAADGAVVLAPARVLVVSVVVEATALPVSDKLVVARRATST
jgi:hypothetical protein